MLTRIILTINTLPDDHFCILTYSPPSQNKLYRIFELAADCKFEKLRDFIAKEIGLKITIESLGWI